MFFLGIPSTMAIIEIIFYLSIFFCSNFVSLIIHMMAFTGMGVGSLLPIFFHGWKKLPMFERGKWIALYIMLVFTVVTTGVVLCYTLAGHTWDPDFYLHIAIVVFAVMWYGVNIKSPPTMSKHIRLVWAALVCALIGIPTLFFEMTIWALLPIVYETNVYCEESLLLFAIPVVTVLLIVVGYNIFTIPTRGSPRKDGW